jgi:GNAT superfamily N-acetyltransferase
MAKHLSSLTLTLRSITGNDHGLWEPLWRGYLDFYQKIVPAEATEFTWRRLTTTHEVEGFLAVNENGEALGLVHFFFHPNTFTLGGNCYLEDLFVIPSARGQRIGRRLIAEVVQAAKAKGAAIVYWQTEEFNGRARRLYERVAKRSPFIRYQIEL